MSEHDISDAQLTAYLDGEVSPDDQSRIKAALDADGGLATRLQELDVPLDGLKSGMEDLLRFAPAPDLPAASGSGKPWALAGGALAAGIALGALLMTQLAPAPKAPGWIDYVASYQALYSTETLSGISPTPRVQSDQLELVSRTVGRPLQDAATVPGFDFKRAQVLGFKGKPLIQMAYLTDTGVPMAFCIIASSNANALKQMEREGLQAASWSDGQHAYLLIGGQDAQVIEAAAKHLQSAL